MVNPPFKGLWHFNEELAAVKVGNRIEFVDRTGNFVVKPEFGWALKFPEGLAAGNPSDETDTAEEGRSSH